jgi:hypothetical protein
MAGRIELCLPGYTYLKGQKICSEKICALT